MKKLVLVLPFVVLGGCAGLTSDQLAQDVRIGIGVAQRVSCLVAAQGGFGSLIVQMDSSIACQLVGGTVAAR